MAKATRTTKTTEGREDEAAFVAGQWYLFTAPGGFTLIGEYVRPLGMGTHRWRHTLHLLNAGGIYLPDLCRDGPGPETRLSPPFPGFWSGTPIWWSDYFGGHPWST